MRNRLTRLKKADPFTLGREKENPPVEKYMNGDPDSWGETPYDKNHWEEDKREETNHAAESEHNFGASVKASVKVARELREKALKCVHIASTLFPTASEETLEAQGFDLMELSDRAIQATLHRIAELEDKKEEEAHEDEQEEVMKEARSLLAKVRSLIAEAEEDEKEAMEDEEEAMEDEACEDEDMSQAEKAASILVKKASALVAAAEYEEEVGQEEEAEEKKEAAKKILAKAKKILAGELPPELKENAEKMKKLHEEGAEVDNSSLNTEGLEEDMSLEEKKEAALRHLAAAKKLMAEVEEDKEEAMEEEAKAESEEAMEDEEEAMEEDAESEDAMEDEEEAMEEDELSMEEVDMIPSEKDEALEDLFMSPDMKDAKEAYEDAFGGEAEKEEKQASKTASKAPKKGAKTLKSGLKISSVNSAEDLSTLWDCPPDVSHLFK